jgi:hypothetical protein
MDRGGGIDASTLSRLLDDKHRHIGPQLLGLVMGSPGDGQMLHFRGNFPDVFTLGGAVMEQSLLGRKQSEANEKETKVALLRIMIRDFDRMIGQL